MVKSDMSAKDANKMLTEIKSVDGVQFAMGFKDDNADGKTRGLMCLASGFIVFAVSKAYDMFKA